MTVQQAIDRIMSGIPGERLERTVDTVKAGNPGRRLTGIVTTFMATRAVLARAAELGANLVITHEPAYYNHLDETDWLAGDPVYESKKRFIEANKLVVWRFHDYWHRHQPDGILTGLVRKLGWKKYQCGEGSRHFKLPRMTLRGLAETARKALGIKHVRIAGDPEMPCSAVALGLGYSGGREQMTDLRRDDVDVVICGESAEWETCEYVRDASFENRRKGLVILGHCDSEESGMEYLAEWLKDRLPGIPVQHVPAGNPLVTY